jgi:hypothetical protein
MKKIGNLFFASLISLLSADLLAETTNAQQIREVLYNGASKNLYFTGFSKWEGTSCSDAKYVQVRSDILGHKEILSIGLSAKMAKSSVRFQGVCSSDSNYFYANYIIIE